MPTTPGRCNRMKEPSGNGKQRHHDRSKAECRSSGTGEPDFYCGNDLPGTEEDQRSAGIL